MVERPVHDLKKILIVQTAFIGDVILVTPLIRACRNHFPAAAVDILVIPAAANLVETNPGLGRVIVYDKRNAQSGWCGFVSMAKQLRQEGYDLLLVPHRSLRSALLAWWSRAPWRVGFSTSSGAWLFTRRVVYDRSIHEVERNLSLLTAMGIDPGRVTPELFPTDEDRVAVDRFLGSLISADAPLVAIAPGSIWATKRWPAAYYLSLAEKAAAAGFALVLIGGESDRALCDRICSEVGARCRNSAGLLTLRQSAELLRRADVLVSNDSAPLHLASAVNVSTVAIFGPTVPAFGFYPYSDRSVVVQNPLNCRPCAIHGGIKCPIGTHECMISISPERVLAEVIKIIKRKNKYE